MTRPLSLIAVDVARARELAEELRRHLMQTGGLKLAFDLCHKTPDLCSDLTDLIEMGKVLAQLQKLRIDAVSSLRLPDDTPFEVCRERRDQSYKVLWAAMDDLAAMPTILIDEPGGEGK